MTAATATTAESIIAENERLRALVEHLRQDTSAGFSRGRVRASYMGTNVPPVYRDFGLEPLDI